MNREKMINDLTEFENKFFNEYDKKDVIQLFEMYAHKTDNHNWIDWFKKTFDKSIWDMVVNEFYTSLSNEGLEIRYRELFGAMIVGV